MQLPRIVFGAIILLEIGGKFAFPQIASDFTWLGLIITSLFAWGVAEAFRMPPVVFWLAISGVILDGASALYELYSRIEPWDLWIHAWGGLIIASGALELVLRNLKEGRIHAHKKGLFIVLGVLMIVAGVGFLYEFWEYLVDRFQYGYPKSLVSAYDSIEDQLCNLMGATVVLAGYFIRRKWATLTERALP